MSYFVCPCCNKETELFPSTTGGAKGMCDELGLKLLGTLPQDPRMAATVDKGEDFFEKYPDTPLCKAFLELGNQIKSLLNK